MDLGLGLQLPRRRAPAIISTVYDTDADALFPRFTNAPSRPRRKIISDTIVALKNSGTWPLLDAFYMTAAADAQAARQNWKGDVYNLVAVNAPIFLADRYYAGNATSSYLDTGFNATRGTPTVEVLTDPDFLTGSGWLPDAGWTISGGVATKANTGATSYLRTSNILTAGQTYAVTYKINSISGGAVVIDSPGSVGVTRNSPGTYTDYLTPNVTTYGFRVFGGIAVNAVFEYISVKETAATKFRQDSASLGIHTLNEVNLADAPIGVNLTTIVPRSGGQAYVRMNDNAGAAASSVAIPSSVGTLVGNRSAQNAQTLRMDGAPLIGVTNASSPPANENFWLCGRNNGTGGQYSARQVAAAFIGGSLTVTQQDNTALAIKSYLASVGAIP